METDLILYGLLWLGFITLEIVLGVRITRHLIKRFRNWRVKKQQSKKHDLEVW